MGSKERATYVVREVRLQRGSGSFEAEEVGLGWLHAEGRAFQAEATSTKGCFYLVNP